MRTKWAAAAAVLAWAATAPATGLKSGPMLSYSEMTEAGVWVQTKQDARVHLAYRAPGATGWTRTPVISATRESDRIAHFRIDGLAFGTTYEYKVFVNNREERSPAPLTFKTQPHWRWRTEPPAFKFVIGSCSYTTETTFDRPGQPYGGDYETFASIDKEKPDFMVWMGDNWYYREPDWLTEAAMRYRASYDRAQSYYQPLWRSFPHYATWDDHDFGPNDSDRTFRLRDEALDVFSDYFPTASPRGWGSTKGSFFRFEWGDIEFFMLDDRFHRTPNRWANRQEAQMLGPEQLQWLKESLTSSNAAFKVIVNGGQMIQPMVFFEAFGQFPAEQKSLFDYIAQNDIRGVVFLSGDRHATELLRVQYPGAAYPWTEFTCSPLSAGAGQNDREANNPARVPGTWVTRKRNFGVIEVSGPRDNRVMTMSAKDKDGATLWTHSVNARDLRRPN